MRYFKKGKQKREGGSDFLVELLYAHWSETRKAMPRYALSPKFLFNAKIHINKI